jgi:serine/threonine-protein kinase
VAAQSSIGKYSKHHLAITASLAVLIAGLIGALISWNLKPLGVAPQTIKRFAHTLPEDQQLSSTGRPNLAISPDGTKIIYCANEQIYLRQTDELEAGPIRGTDENIRNIRNPFFSPDGLWVGFFSDTELKKIAVTGGAPIALCNARGPYGASWGADNAIVFGQRHAIMRVSADGGTPEVLVNLESGETAYGPQILPDGKELLFAVTTESGRDRWDKAQIVLQSLETGERKILIPEGSEARYAPTGHLIYAHEETLFAVSFDLAGHEVRGGAVPIVEGVMRGTNPSSSTGAANFSFSSAGSLIYIPAFVRQGAECFLAFADRDGTVERLPAPQRQYHGPMLSPDGKRVAVSIGTYGASNVYIYDIDRSTLQQLTFGGGERPIWTPDGKWVTFSSTRERGVFNIYRKPADSSGDAVRLTSGASAQWALSWSPGGDVLIFAEKQITTDWDILWLSLEDVAKPQTIVQTDGSDYFGVLSPNGRWLAYSSNEQDNQNDIYVQAFPSGSGGKWRVSTEGGTFPRWAQNGKELFYWNDGRIMTVKVTTDTNFTHENPVQLPVTTAGTAPFAAWDISPDGRCFLVLRPVEGADSAAPTQQINIVLNWFEELKRLVPTGN